MNSLIFTVKVTIIGKLINKWSDKEGNEHSSPILNYQQNNGQHIGQLRVAEELFAQVEAGKEYLFDGEYGVGKNGGYIRVTGISNTTKGV